MNLGTSSIYDAASRRTVLDGGLEFHAVETGGGRPLIFLHGVLGDWRTWEPQWPAFAPHFRTISYSRRYNWPNENDHPQPDHSALVEADDLAQLMDRWDTGPAILVGASYGAFTALALAVRQPRRVRALVLVEPPMLRWADLSERGREARASFEREVREPAKAAFEQGDTERGVRLLTGGIVGARAMKDLPAATMERRLESARSIVRLTLSTDEFPWISPEEIRAITVPTLLMAGERTPPIHETVFNNLVQHMPQARAVRIGGAGHAVARDNPAEFNRVVEAFLSEHRLWT